MQTVAILATIIHPALSLLLPCQSAFPPIVAQRPETTIRASNTNDRSTPKWSPIEAMQAVVEKTGISITAPLYEKEDDWKEDPDNYLMESFSDWTGLFGPDLNTRGNSITDPTDE